MKRSLAFALVAAVALCLGGAAQPATVPAPTPAALPSPVWFTVDAGAGDQTDPHISGPTVTYTSEVNGGSAVGVFDLASGSRVELPTNGGMDFLSDVSGPSVTYTHLTNQSDIALYDTTTGQSRILAPALPSNRRESRIGGSTLAWQDFDYTWNVATPEIDAYDLSTDTLTRLTDDSLLDKDPAVSPDGNTVVWTKCQQDGTGCTIWEATRGTSGWQSGPLTDTTHGEAALPDTDGQTVVYTIRAGGDEDVYWQPVGGGTEQQLALPGQQTNANVSNGVITFEQLDTSTPVPNFDLYAYDIATGTLYRVTDGPADETLNDVSVSPDRQVRIVWTTAEADYNVYGVTFQLPPLPAAGYAFSGFLLPVLGAPAVNSGHAGRTYAVKWQLADANGAVVSALSAVASISYRSVSCGAFTGDPLQAIEASTAGNTSLRYDTTANAYIYNWSTPKVAGCYALTLTLDTGQAFDAYFQLT